MAELKDGVYYARGFSTLQKKRMIAGIFTEYSSMAYEDIIMVNTGDVMMVLVLPRLPNVISWELTRNYHSHCGTYSLVASLNIILEHMNDDVRTQLSLEDDAVDNPLLQNFPKPIRLVGMKAYFPQP